MIEKICFLFIVVSVVSKFFHLILYKNFEKSLIKMSIKKDGMLFGKISKKYIYCHELNKPVNNSYAFVRTEIEGDYLQRKSINFFQKASYFFIALSTFFTFIVYGCSIFMENVPSDMHTFIITDKQIHIQIIGLICFILTDKMINIKNVIEKSTILIVDYLDNNVAQKYRENKRRQAVKICENEDENQIKKCEEIDLPQIKEGENGRIYIKDVVNKNMDKAKAEEIISQVLQEYLV